MGSIGQALTGAKARLSPTKLPAANGFCQSGVAVPEADISVNHIVTANAGKRTTWTFHPISHSSFSPLYFSKSIQNNHRITALAAAGRAGASTWIWWQAQALWQICAHHRAGIAGDGFISTIWTWSLHRQLPDPSQFSKQKYNAEVYLLRDQRYGKREREVLDVYIPVAALEEKKAGKSGEDLAECPVALFCHGGVWAAGAKWQYAPLAASLAKRGILTCVVQYTLYPQALVPQMVQEISSAVSWVLDHSPAFGGSPRKISLVGHSAGAQLGLMALLHRAKSKDTASINTADARMPARFIGMAGAYDIGLHYKYEEGRGVAYLSTMARAIGGPSKFASQSPAVILEASMDAAGSSEASNESNRWQMFQKGERIAENPASGSGIVAASVQQKRSSVLEPAMDSSSRPFSSQDMGAAEMMHLSAAEIRRLPPVHLMSSRDDITVPWEQSRVMHTALRRCNYQVQHTVYSGVGHADFAIHWPWKFGATENAKELPEFASELIDIIKEGTEA